eukprot:763997-Hanusia_phi.AAC.3
MMRPALEQVHERPGMAGVNIPSLHGHLAAAEAGGGVGEGEGGEGGVGAVPAQLRERRHDELMEGCARRSDLEGAKSRKQRGGRDGG